MGSVKKITSGEPRETRNRRCRNESLNLVDIDNSDDELLIENDDTLRLKMLGMFKIQ